MRANQPFRNVRDCSTGVEALEARVHELQGQMGFMSQKIVDIQRYFEEEANQPFLKTAAKENFAESHPGNGHEND